MASAPNLRPSEPTDQEARAGLSLVPKSAVPGDEPVGGLPIGAKHPRAFVGAAEGYDIMAATQFSIMTLLGLRQDHYFLDIGCGSLRGGRLFIPYLEPERYHGIEPEAWLVEHGIEHEVGRDLIDIKRPVFSDNNEFRLSIFDQQFDFVLAQSIFSHASRSQITSCLEEAGKVMAPGALFVATFLMGEKDYAGDAWVYPGCVTYTMDTMRALGKEQGLVCRAIDWPHAAQQTWLIFAHEENAEQIPDLDDSTKILSMENDLRFAKARLAKLQNHPYVRLGMNVVGHPLYTRMREATSRLRKAA